MDIHSQNLLREFNKIILISTFFLIGISLFLFKVEYDGNYKTYLSHLDLYFKMESKILDYALMEKDHQPEKIPLTKTDFCTAFIIDAQGKILNHTLLNKAEINTIQEFLPPALKKNYQESLLKGPENERFHIGGIWAYKTYFEKQNLFLVVLLDHSALSEKVFWESVDTLFSILGALSILIGIVYFLIRREFVTPAKDLIHHLEQESLGMPQDIKAHPEWKVWFHLITKVFHENRHLIAQLEETIKTLDDKVLDRTREIQEKNKELEDAFKELKKAQGHLILQEKMASLGNLTAGIAHEMKNPLNFIINFSDVSKELIQELLPLVQSIEGPLPPDKKEEIEHLATDLKNNMTHIQEHGQRADHIIRSMLVHAHGGEVEKTLLKVNILLEENLQLALSGFKGQHPDFHVKVKRHFEETLPLLKAIERDLGRVFLNLFHNACYALWMKKKDALVGYDPTLWVHTRDVGAKVEIRIRDNGPGIPEALRHKIFEPFFTTKPTDHGTGLGLSLCYDIIVNYHRGTLDIDSQEGEYTEFTIQLPVGS